MILIKDNHIAAAGGIEAAVHDAQAYLRENNLHLAIEIETRTLDEVNEVLRVGGVDRIMLDNMARKTKDGLDTSMLVEAVRRVGGRFETEASGNVTLDTVSTIAATGVDFISSGAITHSVKALDIALNVALA